MIRPVSSQLALIKLVVRLSRNSYLFVLGRRRYWGDSVSELFGFGLEVLDL